MKSINDDFVVVLGFEDELKEQYPELLKVKTIKYRDVIM